MMDPPANRAGARAGIVKGLVVLFLMVVSPPKAWAACASPAGAEGNMMYNGTYHVMQFCDGTNWRPMDATVPGTGGAGCASPSGVEGNMFYNGTYHVMQYCDGTYWRKMGTIPTTGTLLARAGYYSTPVTANGVWADANGVYVADASTYPIMAFTFNGSSFTLRSALSTAGTDRKSVV